MLNKEIVIPEELFKATLLIVSHRTRLICDLSCLNEDEKRMAIDDMIERQMRSLWVHNAMGQIK